MQRFAPDAQFVSLRGDGDTAYGALLAYWWLSRESFVVVEHDIAIHDTVLPQFEECQQPWCTFPYSGGHELLTNGLGCARFAGSFTSAHRDVADALTASPWWCLDTVIAEALGAPHVHQPPVSHVHRWQPPPAHLQPCGCPTCRWVGECLP